MESTVSSQGAPQSAQVAPQAPIVPPTLVLPPVPSGPTLAAQWNGTPDSDLRQSLFEDDVPAPGKKLYALEFNFHGAKVFANPLSRRDYKRFIAEAKQAEAELDRLSAATRPPTPGNEVTTPEGEAAKDTAFAEQKEADVEAALLRKTASETEIIRAAVVDWTLPNADGTKRPYNEETLRVLRSLLKAELASMIISASVVTRAESDL